MISGPYITCAQQKSGVVRCWGGSEEDMEYKLQDKTGLFLQLIEYNGDFKMSIGSDQTICSIKYINELNYNNKLNNGDIQELKALNPKYQDNLMKCWGKCANNLCDIPKHLKNGVISVSVGHAHFCAIKMIDD